MTSSNHGNKLIIILGSGPGIGVHVAAHFAAHGFNRIALLSRNAERLKTDAEFVSKAAAAAAAGDSGTVEVKIYPTDLAVTGQIEKSLDTILQELGEPEVVVYNAAKLEKSGFFEYSESDLELGWKVCICRKIHLDKLRRNMQTSSFAKTRQHIPFTPFDVHASLDSPR